MRCAFGAALAAGTLPRVARADPPAATAASSPPSDADDSRALGAPLAGAVTLLVPFVVGGVMAAQDDNPRLQNVGSAVMLAGLAAAPWVSHAVAGKWRRALAFGGAALVMSAVTGIVMAARDPYDPELGNRKRLPFGFLFTASFFFGAGGVVDSFIVGPDPREP